MNIRIKNLRNKTTWLLAWPQNDLRALLFVLATQIVLGYFILDYAFSEKGSLRVTATLLSLAPLTFIYLAVSFVVPPYLSAALISSTLVILGAANKVKMTANADPLTWSDVSSLSNVSVIWTYLTWQNLLAVVILLSLIVAIGLLTRTWTTHRFQKAVKFMLCVLMAPVVFYPYVNQVNETFAHRIQSEIRGYGIAYSSWDWTKNLENNGLLYHLIQTSVRSLPSKATPEEQETFDRLRKIKRTLVSTPANVIIILCESCWHNDAIFREHFTQFQQLGFTEFRAVSPSYGGLTVNAEFELLVGLPARELHAGVIYQEYSSLISDNALTYPQALTEAGYTAVAAHNHHREFWKRNVVNGKLGFDRFLALGDMNYDGPTWADDKILYDTALDLLETNNTNNFLFLTTVYSHGPYKFQDDFGEGIYQQRLQTAMERATDFARAVIDAYPNSLIVLLGDHKPALTRFFFESGTFPESHFNKTGEDNSDFVFKKEELSGANLGDVPGYVYHPDEKRVTRFIKHANNRPFFCITEALNKEFTNIELPAFNYSEQQSICEGFSDEPYNGPQDRYPPWLYSKSLFDTPTTQRQ